MKPYATCFHRLTAYAGVSRKVLVLAVMAVLSASVTVRADFGVSQLELDREFASLDNALKHRQSYIAARQARIDTLVTHLGEDSSDNREYFRIARQYTAFNNDSALHYFYLGRENAQTKAERDLYTWNLAALLPLAGYFEVAQNYYNSINADSVPAEYLASYYESGRQMHSYIRNFYSDNHVADSVHTVRMLELQAKLLEVLPKDSPDYKYNLGEYYLTLGNRARAKALLTEVFEDERLDNNLRARTAHHLAQIFREEGRNREYLYFLASSALADVNGATREVSSLQELGSTIGEEDVERAHRYLSAALENAVECGASLRMIETSMALPFIERSHSADIRTWRSRMVMVVVALLLLLIGTFVLLARLRAGMEKQKRLEQTLREANKTKEVYISQFLSLCSIYMDKLNQFCKIANRKLAAGQADELYRMTKSGKFVEEQSKEFYEVFDNAFLHIFPDFVADVNTLLKPDSRIELKEGEQLNTDLRILAFLRLGIKESPRIAQVLNYSLNTIYSYRNRLRARALDPENFESQVANL